MKPNKFYPMKFTKFFDFINACDEVNLAYFWEFIQTENPWGGTSCDLCFFKVFYGREEFPQTIPFFNFTFNVLNEDEVLSFAFTHKRSTLEIGFLTSSGRWMKD
jgi:hypothetical protein